MGKHNNNGNKLKNRKPFHCTSEAQKWAIKRSYAIKAKQNQSAPPKNNTVDSVRTPPLDSQSEKSTRDLFPEEFPFWARFKPNKNRTTLVIDEELNDNEKIQFVHREAIHCTEDNKYVLSGDYEKVYPNPDTTDKEPMYLKRPHKHPIRKFGPHNKNLSMPENLRQRYDKNNYKGKPADGDDGDK